MKPATLRKWGWRSFGLMWIPFAVFMVVLPPPGSYTISEMPWLARYSFIAMMGLFITTFVLMIASTLTGGSGKQTLTKTGRHARANILAIYDTGTTANNAYLMGFELEVNPPTAPIFRTTTEQLISRLEVHKYEVGMEVEIRYDPDTRAVAIINEA